VENREGRGNRKDRINMEGTEVSQEKSKKEGSYWK